jgi:hypothetical protein
MTEAPSRSERLAEHEFRIGSVLNRAWSVLLRNFLTFFLVTAIASLPDLLFTNPGKNGGIIIIGAFVSDVMRKLSQALVLYGAFQQTRGKPVSLVESLRVGFRRIVPVIGLAISASVLMGLGFVLLIVPGLIVATMLFVATPACVVEQLGPFSSMDRSARLTKGHRWRIFGLFLLIGLPVGILGEMIDLMAKIAGASGIPAAIGHVILDAIWGAGYAALVIATYHDLRVTKEGVDTVQIAAVFE